MPKTPYEIMMESGGGPASSPLSGLGKAFDVLDTDLNATTNLIRPLVTAINPKLNEVYDSATVKFGMPNVVPSDLIEAAIPGPAAPKAALGFLLDVAMSPTTYIAGIGLLNRSGLAAAKLKAIGTSPKLLKKVTMDSPMAKEAAKLMGVSAPSRKIIREATKLLPESLEDQARKGYAALVTFGIPWGPEIFSIRGARVLGMLESTGKMVQNSEFGKAFSRIFRWGTGNRGMDALFMRALGNENLIGTKWKESAIAVGEQIKAGAKEYGLSMAQADTIARQLAELKNPDEMIRWLLVKDPRVKNNITNLVIQDEAKLQELVHSLTPALEKLTMGERAKFQRDITTMLRDWNGGKNVYVLGLRMLSPEYGKAFTELFTSQIGLRHLKSIPAIAEKKLLQGYPIKDIEHLFDWTKFGDVYQAYHKGLDVKLPLTKDEIDEAIKEFTLGPKFRKGSSGPTAARNILDAEKLARKKLERVKIEPGEDAAIAAMFGVRQFRKWKAAEEVWRKQLKDAARKGLTTEQYFGTKMGQYTELAAARHVVRDVMAHTDFMFSSYYTMYRSNPKWLQKISPEAHAIFNKIDNDVATSVSILEKEFGIQKDLAKRFPILLKAAELSRRDTQRILIDELNANVNTTEYIANLHYLTRIPTKPVREWLQETMGFKNAAREWTTKHVSMLARQLWVVDPRVVNQYHNLGLINSKMRSRLLDPEKGRAYLDLLESKEIIPIDRARTMRRHLTVPEVDALSQSGKLKLTQGKSFQQFFEPSPANSIVIRGQRAARAITGRELFEGAKAHGTWVPYQEGWGPPAGLRWAKADELAAPRTRIVNGKKVTERLAFDPAISQHLDRYFENIVLPVAVNPALEIFDKMQDTWKLWTLAVFPVYHIRNVVGNVWNNMLAGMDAKDSVRFYGMAGAIQKGGKITVTSKAGIKYTEKQIIQWAQELGILNTGQFHGDILKYFNEEARGLLYAINHNEILNTGLKVGNWLENNAKLGHFMWQLENGWTPAEAAFSVKKYLFDYRLLTPAEQHVFRRIAPFYTWTRNNIPLQLEALLTHPARALTIPKMKNVLETNYDGIPDERYLPDWMVQNFPIRIRKNPKTGNHEYFLLGSWLPTAEVDKLFRPDRYLVNMMSPLLKEPMQQIMNRDAFTGRDIDKGGEYERIVGVNMPKRYAHVLRNIRILSEPTRILQDLETDLPGSLTNIFVGKLMPYNERQERSRAGYQYSETKARLKSNIKRARKRGDEEEVERIRTVLQRVRENRTK